MTDPRESPETHEGLGPMSVTPQRLPPSGGTAQGLDSFVPQAVRRGITTVARQTLGVAVAAGLGAVVFLIVSQEGQVKGYTDLDFARGLALSVGADGINRQEVGSTGLYATIALAVALVALYALIVPRILRRSWWQQAVPFAVVVFLLWGLVFSPVRPSGILALEAGGVSSAMVGLVGAIAFALVTVRAYTLITAASWWADKEDTFAADLDAITRRGVGRGGQARNPDSGPESLELPEEGREEGRVRPGA